MTEIDDAIIASLKSRFDTYLAYIFYMLGFYDELNQLSFWDFKFLKLSKVILNSNLIANIKSNCLKFYFHKGNRFCWLCFYLWFRVYKRMLFCLNHLQRSIYKYQSNKNESSSE